MNHPLLPAYSYTLGDSSIYGEIGRYLNRSRSGGEILLLICGLLIVAGLAAALYFWDKRSTETVSAANTPLGLFRELCAAHGLSTNEAELLRLFGDAIGTPQPALLFIKPEWFEHHAATYPEMTKYLQVMEQKIFDGPLK